MKKKKFIYALSALLLLGGTVGLASCGGSNTPDVPNPDDGDNPGGDDGDTPIITYMDGFTVDLSIGYNENSEHEKAEDGSINIYVGETVNVVATSSTSGVDGIFTFTSSDDTVATVTDNGTVTAQGQGTATITVQGINMDVSKPESERIKTVTINVVGDATKAEGAFNYVGSSYEEKLDVLGKLEKYAVDNHLTGITLFENGGYVMYNSRIERPTNKYITGYGMGILSEGKITSPMSESAETNANWRMYYHSYGGTNNKQNFNYLDDTGSESADLYGYIASTYYSQKLNSSRDGYDYYPVLAKENPETGSFMPEALNTNPATGLATQYKVYVRTGEDGLTYDTLSTKPGRQEDYKGRGVELEDYKTPFMLLLNGSIGLARNTDYTSDSNNATLKGARAFSNLTKNASNGGDVRAMEDTFDRLVGLELNEEENSITFTFNTPVNQFTAMTNLSSSLNSPIPLEFVEQLATEVGDTNKNTMYASAMTKAYGTINQNNSSYTPVDNILSLSPYTLEYTDTTMNVYKRNPNWFEFKSDDPTISSRYSIEGIKISYIAAAASDNNAAFKQFIETGSLDACSIPMDYIDQYVNDPRTTVTEGDSTFKLNLNTATQAEWDELFKSTSEQYPYTCEPLMSNDNFVNALSFAINRQEYAQKRGSVASQSYFAPAYLWEPEKGLSYDETAQHKAAISEYSPETDGYNLDAAVQLFDLAVSEEISKGSYSSYNTTVDIDIYWMNTTDTQEYGQDLATYFSNAFSQTEAYKKGFRINFVNHNGTTNYQDVYDRMGRGQFDMAFGSITGMQLDPLGFLEVLKSSNTSGFTLNWGIDTSSIDVDSGNYISYKGKNWSFDSLWTAATKGAVVDSEGKVNTSPVTLANQGQSANETVAADDGTKVNAWALSYRLTQETTAAGVSFRAFADATKAEDEYVTVTITYRRNGNNVDETAVFNANYGELFTFVNGQLNDKGDFNGGPATRKYATFIVYIPKILNENSTYGQVGDVIDLTDCSSVSVSIYATYYMTINDIPVATTLTTTALKLN